MAPKPKKGGQGPSRVQKAPPRRSQVTPASSTASSTMLEASVAPSQDRVGGTGRAGLTGLVKKEITEFIKDCLDDCQRMNSRQRKSLYVSFRRTLYKDRGVSVSKLDLGAFSNTNNNKYFINLCNIYRQQMTTKNILLKVFGRMHSSCSKLQTL